jgi:uncharacterized delta-60 repeat protein
MRTSRPAWAALVLGGLIGLNGPRLAAAAGELDPSFGANGIVITTLSAMEDRAQAGVLQPDGKLVAGGGLFTAGDPDFALVRYLPDGTPDASFGTGALVVTPMAPPAEIFSMALQPDGKIVAAGTDWTNATVVTRYETDGALDAAFGTGGIVVSTIGPGTGVTRSVLLQPDGKIVVVGEARISGNQMFALARFEPDGSVDASFGTAGEVLTDLTSSSDYALDGLLQPDGKIVAAGQAFGPGGGLKVLRYESDGTLDATFGIGGVTGLPFFSFAPAVDLQPDGKLVVAGQSNDGGPSGYDFLLARFDANGLLDAGFGSAGIVITPVGTQDDYIFDVAVQPSGRIVAAGQIVTGFSTSSFGLVRYLPDGTLDAGFGGGGFVTTPFGFLNSANPDQILLQPDQRIVLVGAKTNIGPRDFTHARYFGNTCGDGALEPGEQCDDGNTAAGDCCSPTCQYEPAGTACGDDGDACTENVCDATGSCTHPAVTCALCETCDSAIGCYEVPRAGCLGSAPAGRSSLLLKDKTPHTRDLIRWKWRSGTVAVGDFGDPFVDDYALCIYHGAGQDLWLRSVAPAGGTCGSAYCWKPLSPSGAKYTDKALSPNGIASLVLRSNVPGQIRLKLKSVGVQIGMPALGSLALPVRTQLQRQGACWDVTYPTSRTSTATTFDARVP